MGGKLLLTLLIVLLAACSPAVIDATATPAPMLATATQAATVVPTLSQAPAVTPELGALINVDNQFVVNEVVSYSYRVVPNRVDMVSFDGSVLIMIGILSGVDTDTADELLTALQGSFGEFSLGSAEDILVDGEHASLQPFSSQTGGAEFKGAYVVLPLADGRQLFALGAGRDTDTDSWALEGDQAFRALLGSLSFHVPAGLSQTCTVSLESSYGLQESNPIRVGGMTLGDFNFNLAERSRSYLANLLGPAGERLEFTRLGSVETEDTILDVYATSVGGMETEIYIDAYNYEPLFVPQGFTCAGDFAIGAP